MQIDFVESGKDVLLLPLPPPGKQRHHMNRLKGEIERETDCYVSVRDVYAAYTTYCLVRYGTKWVSPSGADFRRLPQRISSTLVRRENK